MTSKSKQIMIRFDLETYNQLSDIAENRGVQIAPMAREVIKEWLSSRADEVAELRVMIEQLSAKVDQLQKQVDRQDGALDYLAKGVLYCTQSIIQKTTDIS